MKKADVVVIGAGPGGYACAIRLAQLGKKVVLIDRDQLGGTCLNWGCIPSKALIHAAQMFEKMNEHGSEMGLQFKDLKVDLKKLVQWKDGVVKKLTQGIGGLCKKHGIEVINGTASFRSTQEVEVQINDSKKKESVQFEKAVIATGSKAGSLPGVEPDGNRIITSNEAIGLGEIPKKMVLIGGGYIGLELGCFYSMLGSKVSVLEYAPQVLGQTDPDIVKVVTKKFESRGAEIYTDFRVSGAETSGKKVHVKGNAKGGEEKTFEADIVLVATGRKPATDSLQLDRVGLKTDKQGYIPVNKSLQTSVPNLYAIGDVTPGPLLAHRASHEALVAAAHAAGDTQSILDYKVIPSAVFTEPEVASVGLSETEAKEKGISVHVGKFPFAALGRSLANANTEGFCKILGDPKTNDLLGMHVVGPEASNMIAEGALAIEMGASVEDLALTIHTHPTYPEAVMEAAEVYAGHAIHVYQPGSNVKEGSKKASQA